MQPETTIRKRWRVRLEWEPRDKWIGVYDRVTIYYTPQVQLVRRHDYWICLVPCLPIHLITRHKEQYQYALSDRSGRAT